MYEDFTSAFWRQFARHAQVLQVNEEMWFVSFIATEPNDTTKHEQVPCVKITLYKQIRKDPYFIDDGLQAEVLSHILIVDEEEELPDPSPTLETRERMSLKRAASAAAEQTVHGILARLGLPE